MCLLIIVFVLMVIAFFNRSLCFCEMRLCASSYCVLYPFSVFCDSAVYVNSYTLCCASVYYEFVVGGGWCIGGQLFVIVGGGWCMKGVSWFVGGGWCIWGH